MKPVFQEKLQGDLKNFDGTDVSIIVKKLIKQIKYRMPNYLDEN